MDDSSACTAGLRPVRLRRVLRTSYVADAGRLTVRRPGACGSVDLNRLLDVLAPYIRARSVRWDGQMDRALSGVLWNLVSAQPGNGQEQLPMTEPAAGPVVLRHIVGPVICIVVGLGFLVGAATVAVNISSSVVLGILGAAVLIFGLAVLLSVTEIEPGRLTVRSPGRRRTVLLSELASAEIIVMTFRGSRAFALQLRDQQGTTAVLSPGGYPRGRWRLAIAALTPYVVAPEVKRAGQIDEALSGSLWRR